MSRNRYNVSIGITTSGQLSTTTLTAAIALALESEAIKEISGEGFGSCDIERIDVEFDEEVE